MKQETKIAMFAGALAVLAPSAALASTEGGRAADWTWPPGIAIPLALTAALYVLGIIRIRQSHRAAAVPTRSMVWFALGWFSLVLTLDSPIHEIGEQLFWVHMTQHEILMLVSAPLLVLGQPLVPFLYALSSSWRKPILNAGRSKAFRVSWNSVSAPLPAWLLSAAALWVWHIPWLFDRTLESDWIHAAQHTTFLSTALLFWWPLVHRKQGMSSGAGVMYVFTTALHTSILGALLSFTTRPWYAPYFKTAPLWNLSAMEDQQLGGLIMWIPAGTLLLVVALILLIRSLNESQLRWQYTNMAGIERLSGGAK